MAKVTLRKKPISKGRNALYLDYYPPVPNPDTGKLVRREYLKIYLIDRPRTELDREHNRETNQLAESLRAMRQIEIQNERFGFLSNSRRNGDFVAFFTGVAKERSGSNADNWGMAVKYFIKFAGEQLRFSDLNEVFCEQFKKYLSSAPGIGRNEKKISTNTAVSYFSKFRAALKLAFKAGYISENIGQRVDGIKPQDTHREILLLDELRALAKAECESVIIKRAALFSALTGLRFSDVRALTWQEIKGFKGEYYLQYRQEKTDGAENLPVSDEAVEIAGKRGRSDAKVFDGLKYSQIGSFLPKWLLKAGIEKHITFHSFRHTFATLQLASGTDIYTVSKLLGHLHVKTTEIYTKVTDVRKREAANKITLGIG
ncbi:site-specific recombinase XerD [Mucilaginibacter gracilis]|uniref:Site-specific recombinase XerD n=1 Tax=Mucilaginibacter gracilis TaxID=423350 RepID=A0A495J7R5_9SPHI|nr:site-specific integrase [Mucilaginibacter gracilis]RKR84404.1 site-specific recombinase XerD [Mucilaginibacter gracilis]